MEERFSHILFYPFSIFPFDYSSFFVLYLSVDQFSRISSPTERKARMDVNLTQGAIVRICGDNFDRDDEFKPVLQVTDCQNHVLHHLSLSDGSHFATAILFTQLQELVHSRRLQKGSIVKLTHFFVDKLENRKWVSCVSWVFYFS